MGRGRWLPLAILVLALAAVFAQRQVAPERPGADGPAATGDVATDRARYPSFLPPEAVETLRRIDTGGPFPYERDGVTFRNRERLLPQRPRDYYREYTVPTPGSPDRGARRIVTGGDPPEVYYYTDDHYRSFREVEVAND